MRVSDQTNNDEYHKHVQHLYMSQPSLNTWQWQCTGYNPTVKVYALITPSNQLVVLVSDQLNNGEINIHGGAWCV